MEKVEFKPEELVPMIINGKWTEASVSSDEHKRKVIRQIAERVADLFEKDELGVSWPAAIAYAVLGGDDDKFLRYAAIHEDPGINENYPKFLFQLQDLKGRHPEIF